MEHIFLIFQSLAHPRPEQQNQEISRGDCKFARVRRVTDAQIKKPRMCSTTTSHTFLRWRQKGESTVARAHFSVYIYAAAAHRQIDGNN